jgi:translation elongation factor EF-Tu-like GTPase
MTVEDVFTIRKRGTVVTGTVELGSVRVGETLQIDDGESVRVDGIEAFRKVLDEAQAGDNVGLLFRDLDRSRIERGTVLTGI